MRGGPPSSNITNVNKLGVGSICNNIPAKRISVKSAMHEENDDDDDDG